jgi:hypothetical protein
MLQCLESEPYADANSNADPNTRANGSAYSRRCEFSECRLRNTVRRPGLQGRDRTAQALVLGCEGDEGDVQRASVVPRQTLPLAFPLPLIHLNHR